MTFFSALPFSMQNLPKECLLSFSHLHNWNWFFIYKGTGHFLSTSFREINSFPFFQLCFAVWNITSIWVILTWSGFISYMQQAILGETGKDWNGGSAILSRTYFQIPFLQSQCLVLHLGLPESHCKTVVVSRDLRSFAVWNKMTVWRTNSKNFLPMQFCLLLEGKHS